MKVNDQNVHGPIRKPELSLALCVDLDLDLKLVIDLGLILPWVELDLDLDLYCVLDHILLFLIKKIVIIPVEVYLWCSMI